MRGGGLFDCDVIDEQPGFLALAFTGKSDDERLLSDEGGGHRWQRIPPNEKRGRVHTSTVTVAVLEPLPTDIQPNLKDVSITTTRGTGPGGQHRNTTESCVIAVHRPSGIRVRIDMRSQHQSRAMALQVLASKLRDLALVSRANEENGQRRKQVGTGMRGDKVRTYRTQDNQVVDHRTGQRWRLTDWQQGKW